MKTMSLIIWSVNLLIMSVSCTEDYSNFSYDLNHPVKTLTLEKELKEVSGIQKLDNGDIAAIQDEKGNIYFLNGETGDVIEKYDFGKKGDYEDVCLFNGIYYVLESNGSIHKVELGIETLIYKFEDSKKFDFEGLCVDDNNNRLLVACKDHGKKKKNNHIYIYGFSLDNNEYEEEEVLKLDKEPIHKKFGASGLAFHPNGDLYLLSDRSKTLLVLSLSGEIKQKVDLNEFIFRKPEGISFGKKGELYISNEGEDGPPNILVFEERI